MITAVALDGLPEIEPGFDLAAAIARHPTADPLRAGDVVVIAHKAVSKAEGRIRHLAEVEPSDLAVKLAAEQGKDPRHLQVILEETKAIIRAERGVIITETRHGFICANAGVDASNVPGEDAVVLLPLDPDGSARAIRTQLERLANAAPAVLITDSFGRAWRSGQCDIAIGCAGLRPLNDLRGTEDRHGLTLKATLIATADLLAAAADLARDKHAQQPVILIRGAERHVTPENGPGAAALIRERETDLFR